MNEAKIPGHDQLLRIIHVAEACMGAIDSCSMQVNNYGQFFDDYPARTEMAQMLYDLRVAAKCLAYTAAIRDNEERP